MAGKRKPAAGKEAGAATPSGRQTRRNGKAPLQADTDPEAAAACDQPDSGNEGAEDQLPVEGAGTSRPAPNRKRGRAQAAPSSNAVDERGMTQRRRNMEAVAQRRAAHFARMVDDSAAPSQAAATPSIPADAPEEDWPGPFSTARQLVQGRAAAAAAREQSTLPTADPGVAHFTVEWKPREHIVKRFKLKSVPTLLDMCVLLLADHVEDISTLAFVPDSARRKLCTALCAGRRMSAEALQVLSAGEPSELVVPDCSLVPEDALTPALAAAVSRDLEVLSLGYCGRGLSDAGVLATLGREPGCLPRLHTLTFRGAYRLSDKGLAAALQGAPNLTSLELSDSNRLTGEALSVVVSIVGSSLKSLCLDGCCQLSTSKMIECLTKLPNLTRLSLQGISGVTDDVVREIAVTRAGGLIELRLNRCSALTDQVASALAACCPNLQLLELDEVKVTDETLALLSTGCRNLQSISFRKCRELSDTAFASYVTAAGASLRHLSLNSVIKIGDLSLHALAMRACDTLSTLDLSWCRSITDAGLGYLVDACQNLRQLRIFGCAQITQVFLDGHSNDNAEVLGRGDDRH